MKLKLAGLSIASVFFAASVANAATPNTVNGGTVHFTGELVNAACAVDTESQDQYVDLGQWRTARLAKAGDMTDRVPFMIKFVECDTDVATTVQISFNGQVDANNSKLLAVSATGGNQTVAQNVGIEIQDEHSVILPPDNASLSTPFTLIDGNNAVKFFARYVATGATKAGQANADATFRVVYQ